MSIRRRSMSAILYDRCMINCRTDPKTYPSLSWCNLFVRQLRLTSNGRGNGHARTYSGQVRLFRYFYLHGYYVGSNGRNLRSTIMDDSANQ